MWHRFTDGARRTVFYAQEEAAALGAHLVGTEHLLLAMLRRDEGAVPALLQRLNVSVEAVRSDLTRQIVLGAGEARFDMMLTPRAKHAIDLAYEGARELQSSCVRSEHLFLGLVQEGEGLAARILATYGVCTDRVWDLLRKTENPGAREEPESQQFHAPSSSAEADGVSPDPICPTWSPLIGSRVRHVIESAVRYARSLGAGQVEAEHIRMALQGCPSDDDVGDLTTEVPESRICGWRRFTHRARRVVFFAQEEAARFGENTVGTEHLLLGLVRESDCVAARILVSLGAELGRVSAEVEAQLTRGDGCQGQGFEMTPAARRVIDLAHQEAIQFDKDYLGTEHLLLALVREGDGLAARILVKQGVDFERASEAVCAIDAWDSLC